MVTYCIYLVAIDRCATAVVDLCCKYMYSFFCWQINSQTSSCEKRIDRLFFRSELHSNASVEGCFVQNLESKVTCQFYLAAANLTSTYGLLVTGCPEILERLKWPYVLH